jgi:hypothetical protein
VVSATPPSLYPYTGDPLPIVQEAGSASGLLWTDTENIFPTTVRTSGRPARSESLYSRSNSTKSPASGASNVSELRLMSSRESARSRVRVDQCVSAVRAVGVPVCGCLRSSCNHVTEAGGP